jgi:hypothetical protein
MIKWKDIFVYCVWDLISSIDFVVFFKLIIPARVICFVSYKSNL